jgi:hypothetical protein
MIDLSFRQKDNARFVIQKIQPALLGLMDGSVSTLAPIFATAGLTGKPIEAFYVDWRRPWEQVSVCDYRKPYRMTAWLPDGGSPL